MAPIARASGVGEASREETAGQLGSVAPLAMGKVAAAVVAGMGLVSEIRSHDSIGCGIWREAAGRRDRSDV